MTAQTRQAMLIGIALVLVTIAVFGRLPSYGFINLDDGIYVEGNPHVRAGLTRDGILWAFTTRHAGNWHPVTWLSLMMDCELFGVNAGAHHTVNLLVHTTNVLLLFGLLVMLTGALWRSGLVAAWFAIHPLHVESVAWIAERKDLLSTFFWLLTVWLYALYASRRRFRFYILSLVVFWIGLMTKPMLVTLPIILLLMDYWPLSRFANTMSWKSLALEKAPFLSLSVISAMITFVAQKAGGAVPSVEHLPIVQRGANAVVSYATYLFKMIWPNSMACFYPYNPNLSMGDVAMSTLTLTALSVFVVVQGRRRSYLVTGWFWYLIMLLPVIGLVQVGSQSMADRYTYLSFVGIFIMIVWGVPDLANRLSRAGEMKQGTVCVLWAVALLVAVAWAVRAWIQVSCWKDAVTLLQHTIQVTGGTRRQYNDLGVCMAEGGRLEEAISIYRVALAKWPDYAVTHNSLGGALLRQNHLDDAIRQFNDALTLDPDYAEAHNNLGIALARKGKPDDALPHFLASLEADPYNIGRQRNLILTLNQSTNRGTARGFCRQAIEIADGANERDLAEILREKMASFAAP
jgi:protein O-mannosyl-transferase